MNVGASDLRLAKRGVVSWGRRCDCGDVGRKHVVEAVGRGVVVVEGAPVLGPGSLGHYRKLRYAADKKIGGSTRRLTDKRPRLHGGGEQASDRRQDEDVNERVAPKAKLNVEFGALLLLPFSAAVHIEELFKAGMSTYSGVVDSGFDFSVCGQKPRGGQCTWQTTCTM